MLDIKKIRRIISADMISRNRKGNIIIRQGFFYTFGNSSVKLAEKIKFKLAEADISANIVIARDIWKPFRGGSPIQRSSHFYIELEG